MKVTMYNQMIKAQSKELEISLPKSSFIEKSWTVRGSVKQQKANNKTNMVKTFLCEMGDSFNREIEENQKKNKTQNSVFSPLKTLKSYKSYKNLVNNQDTSFSAEKRNKMKKYNDEINSDLHKKIKELKQIINSKDAELNALSQINSQIIKSQEAKNIVLKECSEQNNLLKNRLILIEKECEVKTKKIEKLKKKYKELKNKYSEDPRIQEKNFNEILKKYNQNVKNLNELNNKSKLELKANNRDNLDRNSPISCTQSSVTDDLSKKLNKTLSNSTAFITSKKNSGNLVIMKSKHNFNEKTEFENTNKNETMNFYQNLTKNFYTSKNESLSLNMVLVGQKSLLKYDKETVNKVLNSSKFKFVENIFDTVKSFENFLSQESRTESVIDDLYINTKSIINDYKSTLGILSKINLLLENQHLFCERVLLQNIFDRICDLVCQIIECDRSTLYIVDHFKREIWSKSAKSLDTIIRLPFGTGIAGYVAENGSPVILEDVYFDPRFNKDFDILSGYRTKTVICVPVVDNLNKTVIAVLQAINKKGKHSVFDKNDVSISEILSKMIASQIKQSMEYSEFSNYDYKLKKLINSIHQFYLEESPSNMILKAFELLKIIMNTENIQIFYLMNNSQYMRFFNGKHEKIEIEIFNGIVNKVRLNKLMDFCVHIKKSEYHNSLIDLETSLPILTYPVVDINSGMVFGIIQTEYIIRETNCVEKNLTQVDSIDLDILSLLSANLAGAFMHLKFKSEREKSLNYK